ncbi:MAG: OmpA family protein [Polyangiaceae bacterium]
MKKSGLVPGEDVPVVVPIALLAIGGVFASTAVSAAEPAPERETAPALVIAPATAEAPPPPRVEATAPIAAASAAPRPCAPLVVHFAIGASEGPPAAADPLGKLATFLARNASARAVVEGHADAVGDELANLKLSQKRAQWVATRLSVAGAPENALTTRGLGAFSPVVGAGDPTKPEGEPVNRRVVVTVSGADACAPVPEEEIR